MPDNTEETRRAIVSAYNREYAAKNREKIAARNRERYAKNREKLLAQSKARVKAWVEANPEARKEHKRRYREKNREKLQQAHFDYIRDENGEMTDQYKARLEVKTAKWRQGLEDVAGRPPPLVCDVCQMPPDPGRRLHFDHCHTNGHFRGWLCRSCNLALGNVQDDPILLRKLAAYLESNSEGTPVIDLLRKE
jgi:hypothetical protein